MRAVSIIGVGLIMLCMCIATIVLSLDYALAERLAAHIDVTDAFFGLLFLLFVVML